MKKIIIYILVSLTFVLEAYAQPSPTNYIGDIMKDKVYTLERASSSDPSGYFLGFSLDGNYELTITTSGTISLPCYWLKPDVMCKSFTFSQPITLSSGEYIFNVFNFAVGDKLTIKFRDTSNTEEPPIEPITYVPPQNIVSTGPNYIRTTTPLIAKSTVNYNTSEEMVTMQYFDGLGRPVETVQRGITTTGKDLVAIQEYDNLGRQTSTWLPVAIASNNGAFADLTKVKANINAIYPSETAPFTKPVYDLSPLNRTLAQYGPGADWQNNNKAICTGYLTNKAKSGTTWADADSLVCAKYISTDDREIISIYRTDNYPANEVYVTRTKDENGNTAYEFKNKLGQVILTRQINSGKSFDTNYIYDSYGNLRVVLPPEASAILLSATSSTPWTETNTNLKLWAYLYKYDNLDRCISKKLPGCEWIYYVYDKADRLIFTQDGEQRAKTSSPEWTFNKYDAFGRLIISGIYPSSASHASLIAKCKDIVVTEKPGGYYEYTWNSLPEISYTGTLLLNYYDNYYDYFNATLREKLKFVKKDGFPDRYIHSAMGEGTPKGLLIGTRIKTLQPDGSLGEIASKIYYDNRGRVIQVKSTNHLGGIDEEHIAYNFTGQPTKKMYVHTKDANGGGKQTEVYTYTYDHAGRLLKTTHQLNGATVVSLAENTYDELGRLKTNKKGGVANALSTYGYNIRSWTKSITSPLFTQTLYYNDVYGGSTKQYNGNISAMNWQVNDGGSLLGYTFSYDNLSRLTSAVYLVNGAVSTAHTDYKTSYSYDKHGNMKTLTRGGVITATTNGLIDNLTMTYTGNQLTKVDDAVGTISLAESMDFKNYSNVATEYTYNANGAMNKDLNKGITEIQYNSLNLPRQMDIKSPVAEARNEYTYSAGGQKLKVVQKWNPNYSTTPVIGSAINTAALTQSKTTDYVGNKIYENGSLKRILIDGGYIEGNVYHYYLTDHLGNNRVVVNASGTLVQKNHYYPFGSIFAGTTGPDKQPYKYNGKELDQMHGLNLYDYSARYYESGIGRFTTVDPLAEKYYSISPYAYCANNPLRYIDPTGMAYGDFLDEKGNVIGNDGINDERLYVMKTDASKESKKYIKDNSGNINAFRNADNIAYQNSIEIECNPTARQDMVNEISKDNGKGGTKDANNREYGGSVENGVVAIATPGAVANPKTDATASIELPVGKSTFHSHPSGTMEDRSTPTGNVLGGGTTTTYSFTQTPSLQDISNAGSFTNYVFGRSDNKVHIYNSSGTQASIPMNRFVTPKRK